MAQPEGEAKPWDTGERTFRFALDIVRFCHALDARPGVARALGRQLLRAGTSIGANVEEAHAGQSRADFVSKQAIALKEARETVYWLRLVAAAGLAPDDGCGGLIREARELANILGAIVVKTKSSRA
jgi:four helix bundle protein